MLKIFIFFIPLVFLLIGLKNRENITLDELMLSEIPIELVYENLSGNKYNHKISKLDLEKAEIGRQIIHDGKAKNGKLVSKYFKCTDCHNLVKETENPAELSPDKRLEFAIKNDLNYLPASTLLGVYNRKSWYNGDYVKKYGDIIKNAKDTLKNAIQVCAKYCSSGRHLKDWELEGILHYFKKNELKLGDLYLSDSERKSLTYWQKLDSQEKKELLEVIENKYVTAFPATFLETLPVEKRKFGEGANPENGKELFKRSCMSCHFNKRITNLNLIPDKLTAQFFLKNMKGYSDKSMYQIIRWGTYEKVGRRQYMPHYTKEKMSDQQIEEILSYLKTL